ncbi:winged helix-turn-helix transcriptional regulator [Candidatus Woesearchaeota archaeon]|nr:winged helix-turn-helix transcriptional regulator [Candidatus Woesearchaeota archaeon]
MDMYQVKWTRLQSEIFRLFCIKSGVGLNIREIARALKVTPTAVSKSLRVLEKQHIIRVKKHGKLNLVMVEFNRDYARAIQLKRAENLKLIYESGIFDILYNEFPGCTVILFGSYSRGEDVYAEKEENRSDIDIAIIGVKTKDIGIARFDKLLERAISLNFFESWDKIHKNLKDSILNGIVLSGGVDL